MQGPTPKTIKARAVIPIFFSSVTNTSKKVAYMLQEKLQAQSFLVTVTNIGDITTDDFLELTGPIVLIMSTYGNGGSPADGQEFVNWLNMSEKNNQFQNLQLVIMGLGNRAFQHFCGNSKAIRQAMLDRGAKQLIQPTYCNSSTTDETSTQKFPAWSDTLLNKLKQKYSIRELNAEDLLSKHRIVLNAEEELSEEDWMKERQKYQPLLGKEFLSYSKASKCQVLHVKELREQDDGRSTLWLRLKIPEGFNLEPAANVSVYPLNVRKPGQHPLKGSIRVEGKRKCKIPYPPFPYQKLWQISNFNQVADQNIIKYALTRSCESAQIKSKYENMLKNIEEFEKSPVRCSEVNDELKPGIEFMIRLGINSVRPYTLASWEPQKGYFDLVAAMDPKGLTSRYFKSHPWVIRAFPTQSSFYVPSGRPLVMIANGSGIAPFRSLVQCIMKEQAEPIKLYLYFGIQNKNVDFYFKQEWQNYEKEGKIVLRIAESRNENKKVYVQDLIKEDRQFFAKHLFQEKGLIFMCGSTGMAKGVDSQIFQALKLHQPVPFKAFKLSSELAKNKTIIREVFD